MALAERVTLESIEEGPIIPGQRLSEPTVCRTRFKRSYASEFIQLLDDLRGRLVSKPIDMVYGMMFLLPEVLREKIEVDYSQENEYWITYVKLAHVLLTQPGGLSLLTRAPGKNRPVQLPSWCPNWSEESCWLPTPQTSDKSSGCGGHLQPLKAPNVRIFDDLRHIAVYGFHIDRIVYTIPFHPSVVRWGRRYAREWNFWQQTCLQHLEERIKPDTPHVSILSSHLRNLRMGVWTRGERKLGIFDSKTISADDLPEINRCYEELISSSAVSANPLNMFPAEEPKDDYLTPGAEKFLSIGGHDHDQRPYFVTEQGRVGRGCSGDRAGDILVALYTAPELFVLRYEEGSDVARVIGDAYLDGCMDLATMPSEGRGHDELFTLS